MNIAIIPARGGSKGIPKKNMFEVLGKPLLGWTISQALAEKEIKEVYVTTDDRDIASYALSMGSKVIMRPAKISTGISSSESAISHALDFIKTNNNITPEIVVFLQATSPLRLPGDIGKAIKQFHESNANSLFSSSVAADLTLWQEKNKELKSINFDYKNRQMRQEALTQLVENGSIYIFPPDTLSKYKNRLGGNIKTYIMKPWQVHEIDVLEDIELVEYYLKRYLITI